MKMKKELPLPFTMPELQPFYLGYSKKKKKVRIRNTNNWYRVRN